MLAPHVVQSYLRCVAVTVRNFLQRACTISLIKAGGDTHADVEAVSIIMFTDTEYFFNHAYDYTAVHMACITVHNTLITGMPPQYSTLNVDSVLYPWKGFKDEGYWTHPALLDVNTHIGAVFDTDSSWRDGTLSAARVPVALGAYSVPRPTSVTAQVCCLLRNNYRLTHFSCHTRQTTQWRMLWPQIHNESMD